MHNKPSKLAVLASAVFLLCAHREAAAMLKDASIDHDMGQAKRNFERMLHSDHASAIDWKSMVSGAGKTSK
ncbi:hypothetical protein Q3C01_33720 [Bradyrhizobium sp. UFLA05-109]